MKRENEKEMDIAGGKRRKERRKADGPYQHSYMLWKKK